jgi:hypothetical protein
LVGLLTFFKSFALTKNNQNETKVQWNLSAICGTNSATNICARQGRKGVVSDNAGMPIPGVSVLVKGQAHKLILTVNM